MAKHEWVDPVWRDDSRAICAHFGARGSSQGQSDESRFDQIASEGRV